MLIVLITCGYRYIHGKVHGGTATWTVPPGTAPGGMATWTVRPSGSGAAPAQDYAQDWAQAQAQAQAQASYVAGFPVPLPHF